LDQPLAQSEILHEGEFEGEVHEFGVPEDTESASPPKEETKSLYTIQEEQEGMSESAYTQKQHLEEEEKLSVPEVKIEPLRISARV